jgi:hypothetical protein
MAEYKEIDEIVLQYLMKNSGISSSEIHSGIGQIVGYSTTKRVFIEQFEFAVKTYF